MPREKRRRDEEWNIVQGTNPKTKQRESYHQFRLRSMNYDYGIFTAKHKICVDVLNEMVAADIEALVTKWRSAGLTHEIDAIYEKDEYDESFFSRLHQPEMTFEDVRLIDVEFFWQRSLTFAEISDAMRDFSNGVARTMNQESVIIKNLSGSRLKMIEKCTYCGEDHEVERMELFGTTCKTCPNIPEHIQFVGGYLIGPQERIMLKEIRDKFENKFLKLDIENIETEWRELLRSKKCSIDMDNRKK